MYFNCTAPGCNAGFSFIVEDGNYELTAYVKTHNHAEKNEKEEKSDAGKNEKKAKNDTASYFYRTFLQMHLQEGGDPLTAQEYIYDKLGLPSEEKMLKFFCLSQRNYSNLVKSVNSSLVQKDFLNQNEFFSAKLYSDQFQSAHNLDLFDFVIDSYEKPTEFIYLYASADLKELCKKMLEFFIDATDSLMKIECYFIWFQQN